MKIKLMKSLWGMEGAPLRENLERIAASGIYTGIEAGVPEPSEEKAFLSLLEEHGLDYIAMVYTSGPDHYASLEKQVEAAARLKPLSITSHSLLDRSGDAEQEEFFAKAVALQREVGIPIGHETHRGRAMFTPWHTAKLLRQFPELWITADFSHFCCVCESLLEGQEDDLQTIIGRVTHIHARVGYAEGPQVPHPAAPEYARELTVHVRWWAQILASRTAKGFPLTTVTPEFGPPGYLHTLPFTDRPVADLWEVCLWMARHLEESLIRG